MLTYKGFSFGDVVRHENGLTGVLVAFGVGETLGVSIEEGPVKFEYIEEFEVVTTAKQVADDFVRNLLNS